MVIVKSLKRASSNEDCATQGREELCNNKKRGEFKILDRTSRISGITSNNNTRESTVTFSSKNDVFEISRPTKKENQNMHMSKEDQKTILLEVSDGLRRFELYEQQQKEDLHTDYQYDKSIEELGLERIVEQQNSERLKRVKSAICVILKRQRQSQLFKSFKKQQMQKINESWLQKHYRPFSELSAKLARNRGLRDQEMAPSHFPMQIVMSR